MKKNNLFICSLVDILDCAEKEKNAFLLIIGDGPKRQEMENLAKENQNLKNKLENIEKNNLKNFENLRIILENNKRNNNNQLKDIFSLINEKFEGINNENRENIQKINEEIFSIVNLMNKSMFLEIVNKHKDSLDKVFETYEE